MFIRITVACSVQTNPYFPGTVNLRTKLIPLVPDIDLKSRRLTPRGWTLVRETLCELVLSSSHFHLTRLPL
jgi:hypothetical protein